MLAGYDSEDEWAAEEAAMLWGCTSDVPETASPAEVHADERPEAIMASLSRVGLATGAGAGAGAGASGAGAGVGAGPAAEAGDAGAIRCLCAHHRTALLMACVADDQRSQNAPCMSPLRRAASMLVCASCKTRRWLPQAGGCGMYVCRVLPVRHVL